MPLQIVDEKSLRKLYARISEPEVAAVKTFIEKVATETDFTETNAVELAVEVDPLLEMKKVKENANMTEFIKEIREYLRESNVEAAKNTAVRLIEAVAPKEVPTNKEVQPITSYGDEALNHSG